MILSKIKYLLPTVALTVLLGGCREESELPSLPSGGGDDENSIELVFPTRAPEDDVIELEPLEDYFVEGQSILLISQRGNTLNLNFDEYMQDPQNPESLIPNWNLYKYTWYRNDEANWDEGYNFQPLNENTALNWDKISEAEFGSNYAFGALYYPVTNEVNNSVMTDQRDYSNLLRSNPLAAYHTTNALRSRLRFRLNHLMAAATVTLLVPDWDPTDNTGFGPDAVQWGQLLNVKKDFTIDWNFNSSDVPIHANSTESDTFYDIYMYVANVDNEVKTVNLNEFDLNYNTEKDQDGVIADKVRTVTFNVLFPPQQLSEVVPIMRFNMKTMSGATKNYLLYFRGLVGQNLALSSGTVTHFYLYLPRTENNAIILKSYILDWAEAESEFTVIPDDTNNY